MCYKPTSCHYQNIEKMEVKLFNEELNKYFLFRLLDYFGTLEDVFLVNKKQVVEWSRNPVSYDKFSSCFTRETVPCDPVTCNYEVNGETITMQSCVPCPNNYPWLGNPTGA